MYRPISLLMTTVTTMKLTVGPYLNVWVCLNSCPFLIHCIVSELTMIYSLKLIPRIICSDTFLVCLFSCPPFWVHCVHSCNGLINTHWHSMGKYFTQNQCLSKVLKQPFRCSWITIKCTSWVKLRYNNAIHLFVKGMIKM